MNASFHSSDGDTIVAVATPLGASHRAICRLSGPEAVAVARRFFEPGPGAFPYHSATYLAVPGEVCVSLRRMTPESTPSAHTTGRPQSAPSRVPAILYVMRAPRSYTREDVAELHLPGSPPVIGALVEGLVAAGARPARPGEFTRRAFLNGRIDLAQAEAVLGVVRAADDEQLRSALAGLGAAAGRRIRALGEALDRLAALVELGIDFSEEDLDPVPPAEIEAQLDAAIRDLDALAAEPGGVEIPRAEAAVALVGPPNSGKSSLFNALVGHPRSIVSHMPGTTRDVVTAPLAVGHWRLMLADTAGGPRSQAAAAVGRSASPSPLAGEGRGEGDADGEGLTTAAWAAARHQAGASHLLLVVVDRSRPFTPALRAVLDEVVGRAPLVMVLNKSDLAARTTPGEVLDWRPGVVLVETSALTGEGVDRLRSALAGAFASARVRVGSEGLLLPARQARAASQALAAVRRAREILKPGGRPELVALEIRAARGHLQGITGRGIGTVASADTVLDLVFSQFCIGK